MANIIHRILDNFRRRVVYRIFFPFVIIIVIGVSIALPYGVTTTSRIMEETANSQVLSVGRVVNNIIRKDLDKLLTFCELKIYSQPIQDAINRRDIVQLRQLIIPMRARSGVDIVIIFDREGNEILRFDEHQLISGDLKSLKIVRNGLNGMPYQDIVITPSKLILCAIAPNETAAVRGGMNGAMLVGQVVDDSFVSEIKETTGSNLVISNPEGIVMASTLREQATFASFLGLSDVAPALRKGAHNILNTFMWEGSPYRTANDSFIVHQEPRAIISVILNIYDIYRTKQNITTVMILLMIIGVASSIVISLWIAHSISRPIQRLVRATDSMTAGDLSQRIKDVSEDEIGTLSKSFNIMAERLKRDIGEIQEARISAQRYSHELEVINRELKKARNELVQASKLIAMGQLGAGIAHELNQPLLAIGLFAEQTLKYLDRGSSEYKNIEKIVSQTNRMSEIINEIRLFARQSILEPKEVDINIPLKRAMALIEKQLTDANIEVKFDLSEELAPVMADDNQIQQVFLNIITNARDALASQKAGSIVIRSTPLVNGQFVAIDFMDDGAGIPAEIMDDIFMPFFTTKRETKGLGLGLSISYGIIQRHMGTIKVESAPGRGTMFRVLLPTVIAKQCWEEIGCDNCRDGESRETCPVFIKEKGFYCWSYFQREAGEDISGSRCVQCRLYKERQSLLTTEDMVRL